MNTDLFLCLNGFIKACVRKSQTMALICIQFCIGTSDLLPVLIAVIEINQLLSGCTQIRNTANY